MSECLIEGSVEVSHDTLCELILAQNKIMVHQNKILANLADELKEVKYELNQIRGGL